MPAAPLYDDSVTTQVEFMRLRRGDLLVCLLVAGDDAVLLPGLGSGCQRISEGAIVCRCILGRVRHDGHMAEPLSVQRPPANHLVSAHVLAASAI